MEFSELVEESAEQHKIAGNDCMRNNNFTAAIEHYRRGKFAFLCFVVAGDPWRGFCLPCSETDYT